MTTFLVVFYTLVFYTLLSVGFVIGYLIDNGEIPNVVKILMVLFSPVIAPVIWVRLK